MKNFFDVLDRLYESGQPSMSEAISALQGEFPELSADAERAGRIFTAWRSGFGKTHAPKEGYASSEEAEALFLFGDFLRDLATNLASRGPKEKCGLCVFSNDSVCGDLGRSCYDGVEQYLLRQAAAYHQEMEACCKAYPMPTQPAPKTQERQPLALEARHQMYSEMLDYLTLLPKHRENLLERGLSEARIEQNQYRSMPETERGRRLLASLLRAGGHDLLGLPGFRTYYGEWILSGPNGFLIPVRDKDGMIQGMKIRLDQEEQPERKYRWLSSRNMPGGTRSYSWVHITGDTGSKRAFLTEGPLKGDVASFLAGDALFVCIGGVNALGGLTDALRSLGVREVVEAMDMDQNTNQQVRSAIQTMRREVQKLPGIRYSKYTWNPAYKGVDDYFLSRAAAM